ncbi:hypothetical protein COCCADRAFT_30089 [Bipolaris zeicola 26-R-13]|uniref:Nephrocystin 3-like N-terminal domain-containing protein n=1 Tax=Cochliobolus carbonum (strain 26-R-13) TaxID=930089 RepID=W6Y132_COCC2|nr:uncharacterized protein COCCADRAFT_30089 [Bipolaris zeicola 26-R-13]EUC28694.1 hypothetical protein COCCADRAFT_30089 [Bipolaris zeicola 26-R-13]
MFAGQSAQHQNISHEIIEQRAKLCRDALFVSEPEVDRLELVTNKGTRVTGTCEWIKNNGGYRSWNQGETPLLWVTGGPGKGKTMLSIFLTEDLEQELSKYNAGQLVYYFCIHKKRDKGTDLLRSLLYQIIDKRPELAKHAFTYLETPERRAHTLSSLPSLWIILQNIIADATLGDLFCIVDGLDECDEDTRRFLIPRFVDQLEPQSSPNQPESLFRLIIVSRDLEGLEGCEKIDLDEDHVSNDGGDIELFVCEKVKELFQRKKLDVVFQPTVREALISGANGTFLWVGFVINELLKICSS